jgi:hypothetical protein
VRFEILDGQSIGAEVGHVLACVVLLRRRDEFDAVALDELELAGSVEFTDVLVDVGGRRGDVERLGVGDEDVRRDGDEPRRTARGLARDRSTVDDEDVVVRGEFVRANTACDPRADDGDVVRAVGHATAVRGRRHSS